MKALTGLSMRILLCLGIGWMIVLPGARADGADETKAQVQQHAGHP